MGRRVFAIGLIGCLAGGLLMASLLIKARAQGSVEGKPYMKSLVGSSDPVDVVLSWGDGQAYAALARDGGLEHPEVFGGPAELAYRAQRPLLAYATLLLAGGRASATGATLMFVVALSAGLLVGSIALLVGPTRWMEWVALGSLALPGAFASMGGLESEVLGLALATLGIVLWSRNPQRLAAPSFFFALSVLARETMIIVPVGIGMYGLWVRRRPKELLPAMMALGAWGLWLVFVWLRVGEWPFASGAERLASPLSGFRSLPEGGLIGDLIVLAFVVTVIGFALVRRRGPLVWIVWAFVPFALVMGPDVWRDWPNFSRALLAPVAYAGVACVPSDPRPGVAPTRFAPGGPHESL